MPHATIYVSPDDPSLNELILKEEFARHLDLWHLPEHVVRVRRHQRLCGRGPLLVIDGSRAGE